MGNDATRGCCKSSMLDCKLSSDMAGRTTMDRGLAGRDAVGGERRLVVVVVVAVLVPLSSDMRPLRGFAALLFIGCRF